MIRVTKESLQAICQSTTLDHSHVESVCLTADVICEVEEGTRVSSFTVEDWRKAQEEDEVISFWKQHVQGGTWPRRREVPDGNHHSAMFRLYNNLQINENGILCRETPLHRFYYLLA